MNTGYIVLALGVIGAAVGGVLYAVDYHRTIGLGGIALGVLLILAGILMSRQKPANAAANAGSPM